MGYFILKSQTSSNNIGTGNIDIYVSDHNNKITSFVHKN